MSWQAQLQEDLARRRGDHLYRQRRQLQSAQGPHVRIDGRPCTNFSSNDYLGLANHPLVVEAFTNAAREFGVGSGASHLVCGHSAEHHLLEEELAQFTGRDRALLFSTGYMANLGAVRALVGKGGMVFEDKLNHASLLDAGQMPGVRMQRFLHGDMTQLERLLAKSPSESRKLIAVDGVFSMDGDCAPVGRLAAIADEYDALLLVDDAHGFGVLGNGGGGLLEQEGIGQDQVPILMATLGKALGCFGACIAGSELLVETLLQNARTYIYTTALPPAVAAAARASLRLVKEEAWRRDHLNDLIMRLRSGLEELQFVLLPSTTPIQAVVMGDAMAAISASEALLRKGFFVPAIRPPTVPRGTSRLRITLSSAHSNADIDKLLEVMAEVAP